MVANNEWRTAFPDEGWWWNSGLDACGGRTTGSGDCVPGGSMSSGGRSDDQATRSATATVNTTTIAVNQNSISVPLRPVRDRCPCGGTKHEPAPPERPPKPPWRRPARPPEARCPGGSPCRNQGRRQAESLARLSSTDHNALTRETVDHLQLKSRSGACAFSILVLGLCPPALQPASVAGADRVPTHAVSVHVDPTEAPPFGTVRVFGLSCGGSWGKDNLAGFELNSVEDPPTADEGVSLWARDIRLAPDGTMSASFTVPEIAPGQYFLFYLCADQNESRAFRAITPDDRFLVVRRLPYVTAPNRADPTPGEFLTGSVPVIIVALIPVGCLLLMRLSRRTPIARLPTPSDREDVG